MSEAFQAEDGAAFFGARFSVDDGFDAPLVGVVGVVEDLGDPATGTVVAEQLT